MGQVKYWVIDPSDVRTQLDADGQETRVAFYASAVVMTQVLDENDVFDPPPPVRHGIMERGWRVIHKVLPPSGLNDTGSVDWRGVADDLAAALDALRTDRVVSDRLSAHDERLVAAMDRYELAQHEVALGEGLRVVEMEDDDDEGMIG